MGHLLRGFGRTGNGGPSHAHVADANSSDGRGGREQLVAGPFGDARQLVPTRHAGLSTPRHVPPDRRVGRRSRYLIRRSGRRHRDVHACLLWTGYRIETPPGLFPIHRAVGGVRGDLHHLSRGRGSHLFPDRLDRTRRMRRPRPGGSRRGRHRRRGVERIRLRVRHRPLRPDAPRDRRHACPDRERHAVLRTVLVKISLSWLREFVDVTESTEELRSILDDLGLVVEGIDLIGEGLEDVVVARIDEIRAIDGADRVRLVVVDAGHGPLEIVCGAMNIDLGDHVPLAPVGAVLPGGFEIARREMRGVTSNGMLCSARELGLGDDHRGLMLLDDVIEPVVGVRLLEALSITPDVVFDITVEGNRPDAWSVEGVARDLATRLGRALSSPSLAEPNGEESSASFASAGIDAPDLCGRLTVSVLRHVRVGPSPSWVVERVQSAGMRAISNVVDASNLVMLELGQPTHPYDAARVAKRTIRVRRARPGETLETLDGVERDLAKGFECLAPSGADCVIVDGDDVVIGLAGIMGGATSEISDATTDVLLEAAYFDPMSIARSSKRHGLRSEASNRFERGVDPQLGLRAAARFVHILRESCPELEWLRDPLDIAGSTPTPPTIELSERDIERVLGVMIPNDDVITILRGLRFQATSSGDRFSVTPPTARPDVRSGSAGIADVIEEIARLYGYRRLPRHVPTWPEPGGLSDRQKLRRRVRDVVVDLGAAECWTPTLGSDADFDLLHPGVARVRITNPLASDEAGRRATTITALGRAWVRNLERGTGDVVLAEIGTVFTHPDATPTPRMTKGGVSGSVTLDR